MKQRLWEKWRAQLQRSGRRQPRSARSAGAAAAASSGHWCRQRGGHVPDDLQGGWHEPRGPGGPRAGEREAVQHGHWRSGCALQAVDGLRRSSSIWCPAARSNPAPGAALAKLFAHQSVTDFGKEN